MRQPDTAGLKASAGCPASKVEQHRQRCFDSLGLPHGQMWLIVDSHLIRFAQQLKLATCAYHRGVLHQLSQGFTQGVAGHQQHARAVEVANLDIQPQPQPYQRISHQRAIAFPQFILQRQRNALARSQTLAKLSGQGNAMAFSRLQQSLRIKWCDAVLIAWHGVNCRFLVPFGALRTAGNWLDSTS